MNESRINEVPEGYYFDGCLNGGCVKRSRTVLYAAEKCNDKWYISKRVNNGWPVCSEKLFDTPLDAAIALHKKQINFISLESHWARIAV